MHKRNKKNIFSRRFKILKRNLERMNRRKAMRWFKVNIKGHPFALGFVIFVWVNIFFRSIFSPEKSFGALVKMHLLLVVCWLVLVSLSNALKEKARVKWYLRKRFVFFMLIVFQPLGIILLWSGSKFKKPVRVFLTFWFGILFVSSTVYYSLEYNKLQHMSSFERVIKLITKSKKKIFIKPYPYGSLEKLKLFALPLKSRLSFPVSEISRRSAPSIVSIKAKDKNGRKIGLGSGFIVSEDGLIATNFHVLASSYQAEVKIGEQLFKEVYFVKGSSDTDLALIKVNARNLPVLPIGDSDVLINGQFIVVLGNPWGLDRSVSSGLISALRSRDSIKLIQMTAPVSMGSSGGPVLNEYGEVIGVTTAASVFLAQNINFAIPIKYLKEMMSKE